MTTAPSDHTETDAAPGWDAITATFAALYGEQEPAHWAPTIPWTLGGHERLDGVSAYRREGSQPHWHYVGYGLSELYEKEGDDPEWSGMGFELTFRLAADDVSGQPPTWPVELLQAIAGDVNGMRWVLGPGFTWGHQGIYGPDEGNPLPAIVFAYDPELPPIETPNGRVELLQAVGIHQAEREADNEDGPRLKLIEDLRALGPLIITDLGRASIR